MFSTQFIQRPPLPALAITASAESPELLFIHGCTETAETWLPLMQALADAGVGSVAVDLRCQGKSDGYEVLQDVGIKDYVADAKSVRKYPGKLWPVL